MCVLTDMHIRYRMQQMVVHMQRLRICGYWRLLSVGLRFFCRNAPAVLGLLRSATTVCGVSDRIIYAMWNTGNRSGYTCTISHGYDDFASRIVVV